MPLKLYPPKRPKQTSWRIRGAYLGKHVERSARTSQRALAQKVLKQIERDIERGAFVESDEPTFAAAALAYMKAGGERTYVKRLVEHFSEKPLGQIDQAAIDMAAVVLYPNGTPATRNRQVYTPVGAILRAAGVGINLRRPRGSGGNKQTAWLWPEQAEALFAEAKKLDKEFAALCITLCYTGMRLGEALGLRWNDVRLDDGFAHIPRTKNSEPRAVFLPPVAVAALAGMGRKRDRVFRFAKGGHIYSLLKTAAFKSGVELPERSAFHIFRHTYATWMRRYAGLDVRGLVGTGAWKDGKSAARYAHVQVSEEARKAAMLPVGRDAVARSAKRGDRR